MDPNEVCETFLAADKIINGENDASMKMEEISKKSSFYEFCPNRRCVTDVQRIGAMTTYLFLKIRAHQNNEHGEYFLMWLSDKLFKMHKEGKKKGQSNRITLDEAYKKYLDENIGNFKYWNVLDNVKGLKDANLRHMNEFYKLLNHICKTIIYHKFNYTESTNLLQNSTNSSNQYMLLYQNVSKCDSYLHLLDNLKKTYDNFRTIIKNSDSKFASSLQTLTTIDGKDSYFSTGFTKFDFSNSNGSSTKPPTGVETSSNIPDNGVDRLESKDKVVDGSQSKENAKGSEQNNSSQTSSETSPKPMEQTDAPKLPQDTPGNQHSDQNDQEGSQKPAGVPVIKPEHPGNETIGIGDIYIFKGYKQFVISTIVLLLPIALAIMYNYLLSGWRKEMKRKKRMKKVIKSIGGKRPMQIIIKSVNTKKMTSPVINTVRGESKSLLNIYKLMQADPVPFINLFFLLIFFVYKRTCDSIEL
ncbi:CIR protein [Plasmodium chabaudi adami]|uniref:CIR protein n=2 Tax=Plasmodium chabaudi adami TaxID=5826 RepID=A0A1D3LD07_PLACE|nr:CIR protein [Plasmodium chabaudi adami]